jgi:hypothetical protein
MSHQELIALKLQMGINPSSEIAPKVLLAMWQQLKIESSQSRCFQSGLPPEQNQMTSAYIDF